MKSNKFGKDQSNCLGERALLGPVGRLRVRLHMAGLSARETVTILELLSTEWLYGVI